MTRYTCSLCPKKLADKGELSKHMERMHKIEGSRDVTHTTGHAGSRDPNVTQENLNPSGELAPETASGHAGHALSTTDSVSEMQGPGSRDPDVTRDDPDPMTEIRDAVVYLNARRDYLDRWELGFMGSMVFIVLGKTNGDRARHLTPDMVGKLFETRAKVEALEQRDRDEAEYDRIQRHFTDMKKPEHVWCDLCEKDKRERALARAQSDAEDAEMAPEIAASRERRARERLEASRTSGDSRPAMTPLEWQRKREAARKALTSRAKNGEPSDAR